MVLFEGLDFFCNWVRARVPLRAPSYRENEPLKLGVPFSTIPGNRRKGGALFEAADFLENRAPQTGSCLRGLDSPATFLDFLEVQENRGRLESDT